jgi:hypothetical protein
MLRQLLVIGACLTLGLLASSVRAQPMPGHFRGAVLGEAPNPAADLTSAEELAAPPDFSGTWLPADPKADVLFDAGIGYIPSSGKLTVIQTEKQIKMAWSIPPQRAGRRPPERTNSYGISPEGAPGLATWKGDALVIQHPNGELLNWLNVTSALTLVDGSLRIETNWQTVDGRRNSVTESYRRSQLER